MVSWQTSWSAVVLDRVCRIGELTDAVFEEMGVKTILPSSDTFQ